MSEYKYQHFYPKRFLKKFSPDDLNLWMFNGKEQRYIPYESQCGKDNFYSSIDRSGAEKLMEEGEDLLYQNFGKEEISEYSQSLTILLILVFHFRGVNYKNITEVERIEIMKYVPIDYACKRLLDLPIDTSLKEILYKLSLTWLCDIFTIEHNTQQIITSDFPVSLVSHNNSIIMIIFPISKNQIYIAYNKTKIIKTSNILNTEDVLSLNKITAINSYKNIYSHHKLNQSEIELYGKIINNFTKNCCFFEEKKDKKCKPIEININTEILKSFSFFKNNENTQFEIIDYKKAQEIYRNGSFNIDDQKEKITINKNISQIELYCAIRARLIDLK